MHTIEECAMPLHHIKRQRHHTGIYTQTTAQHFNLDFWLARWLLQIERNFFLDFWDLDAVLAKNHIIQFHCNMASLEGADFSRVHSWYEKCIIILVYTCVCVCCCLWSHWRFLWAFLPIWLLLPTFLHLFVEMVCPTSAILCILSFSYSYP